MTSSNQYTFSARMPQIIAAAYRKVGAIAEDETPTAGMEADATLALNSMLKEWAASGIHIWTTQEAVLFLQKGQYRYLLGTGTTPVPAVHCCDAFSYSLSQIVTGSAAGDTTITVADTVGFTNGNQIGVVLNTGYTQWTTISGTPVGNVVTLADALTDAVSVNNFVFTYPLSATIQSPLRIPAARRIGWQGLIETPMTRLSRMDYMNYPNKVNPGTPTQYFYAPELLNGVPQGQFYTYLNPQDSNSGARFTYMRPLQDVTTNPTQTGDFPIEWVNTCIWNLAKEMAPEFDVPPPRWAMIKDQADEKLEMVRGWDREPEAINFGFDADMTAR
jgi:hypothetical protein